MKTAEQVSHALRFDDVTRQPVATEVDEDERGVGAAADDVVASREQALA